MKAILRIKFKNQGRGIATKQFIVGNVRYIEGVQERRNNLEHLAYHLNALNEKIDEITLEKIFDTETKEKVLYLEHSDKPDKTIYAFHLILLKSTIFSLIEY